MHRAIGLPKAHPLHWLSMMVDRVNRSMGQRDLCPFTLTQPVVDELAFVHRLVTSPGRLWPHEVALSELT